jgi:hypothetical protein
LWTWQRWIAADFTCVLFHGRGQGLAAVRNVEPRFGEVESATHQIPRQFTNYRRIFRGSLTNAQDRFPPVLAYSQRGYHLLSFEPCRINRQRAEPEFIQPTLHHVLPLRPACLDKLIHPRALGGQVLGRSTLGIGHALCQKWVIDPNYSVMVSKRFHHFVAEAVRNELDRRRREDLRRSLHSPHPESAELAGQGLEEWIRGLPEEATRSLVNSNARKPVRWVSGEGWVEGHD